MMQLTPILRMVKRASRFKRREIQASCRGLESERREETLIIYSTCMSSHFVKPMAAFTLIPGETLVSFESAFQVKVHRMTKFYPIVAMLNLLD